MGYLFRELSEEEIKQFQLWARENYKPGNDIFGTWHIEVQKECVKMNIQWAAGQFSRE